jgi:hypothetical protein
MRLVQATFFGERFLVFLQGFLGKLGVLDVVFDGKCVVDCGDFVVN